MKRIFLLGGHDLEMLTIRDMLLASGECFHDVGLSWNNATLSAYQAEINETDLFYGIELREDILPPAHYVRIDHHNDYFWKKSALEQVADLLHVPLNRRQQLVVANDSAYIGGMKALGATDEEISSIRQADRKAQGVTEEEEKIAEEDARQAVSKGNLKIVYTSVSRFSPIVDYLYPFRNLLVYNNAELVYYGERQPQLVNCFQEEVKTGRAFHGGGESGFFGLPRGRFSSDEIKNYVESISKIINDGI